MINQGLGNTIIIAQEKPLRRSYVNKENMLFNFDVEHFIAQFGPKDEHYIGALGLMKVIGGKLTSVEFNRMTFRIAQSNFDSDTASRFLNPNFIIYYSTARANQSSYYMGTIDRNSLIDPSMNLSKFDMHLFHPVIDC